MKYQATYKCRKCGTEYGKTIIDQNAAMRIMADLRFEALIKKGDTPPMFDTHVCEGGSFGVAEFIGMKAVEA